MEEFIVSARKYRPASFDTVVGQRALTTTLKNSIASGKLAHAYLFCGPRGVGKTTCARIFAKAINCLNPDKDGEACGECESCRAFNEQRSMNIHELDAASNNSVEDIRELCKQVQIPPQIGRYKVFIIDEVHMLSSAAFNAFLKTLEEPPSYVVFILATTEKHKILPTILSRCQVYDFARMTIQNTVDHLAYVAQKEGYEADAEALNLIAQKADGGMRDALSIFDQMVSFTGGKLTYEGVCQNLNVLNTDYYFRLVDHFLQNNVQECMLLFNEVLQKGFDGGNFIDGLASHLRDLLVSQDEQTLPLLEVSEQMRARYQEQAQRCKPKFLFRAIKLCNDCNQAYRTSRNKRLQVEICLIQSAQLTEEDTPGAGLCPSKQLKPIFSQQTAQSTQGAAKPAEKPAAAAVPSTNQTVRQQQVPVDPTQRVCPVNQRQASPKLATITMSQLSRLPKQNAQPQQVQPTKPSSPETSQRPAEDKPLDEAGVRVAWMHYALRLPQEESALSLRMRAMQPSLTGTAEITVTANNQQVANMLEEKKGAIERHMQQHLQNYSFTLVIKVADALQVQRKYSKPDLYKRMLEKSPALRMLSQNFKLELD